MTTSGPIWTRELAIVTYPSPEIQPPQPAPRHTSHDLPAGPPPARLRLDRRLGRRGAVDGGWWPRSRDASVELPALVTALDASLGAITRRVSIHVDTWDNIPRQLRVDGRTVRVSWFRSMDAHGLTVATDRGDPIELLVIPADTAHGPAGMAMSMAASGKADRRRPTDMLAASIDAARARESEWVGADQEHAWENEGGWTKRTARQGSTPASTV
jgi:hypothetical protein